MNKYYFYLGLQVGLLIGAICCLLIIFRPTFASVEMSASVNPNPCNICTEKCRSVCE
jgi:hypothetical protein